MNVKDTTFNAEKYVEEKIPEAYKKIYGVWAVTTDTDSGSRNLGIHEGFIDMIALNLANQACYGLNFNPAPINKSTQLPTRTSVSVTLHETCLSDLTPERRAEAMKYMFRDRPDVTISKSNYYGGFSIDLKNIELINEKKRQDALKKLTTEERKLLGL